MPAVRDMYKSSASWEGVVEAGEQLADLCGVRREEDGEPVLPPSDAWKTAIATKWKTRLETNKIDFLEGESAILALRHRVRDRTQRRLRVLQLQDNQAILGSFRKGRSSAPRLLLQCRRALQKCLFYIWFCIALGHCKSTCFILVL